MQPRTSGAHAPESLIPGRSDVRFFPQGFYAEEINVIQRHSTQATFRRRTMQQKTAHSLSTRPNGQGCE